MAFYTALLCVKEGSRAVAQGRAYLTIFCAIPPLISTMVVVPVMAERFTLLLSLVHVRECGQRRGRSFSIYDRYSCCAV